MKLTTDDARLLIDLQKRLTSAVLSLPEAGNIRLYPLKSLDNIHDFVARMRMAKGNRSGRQKASYILFYEKNIQLLRLDTYGTGAHFNADGTIIPAHTPHIHIYDEIQGDHNAYALDERFTDPSDLLQTLIDFLAYANVVDLNKVQIIEQGGLFDA